MAKGQSHGIQGCGLLLYNPKGCLWLRLVARRSDEVVPAKRLGREAVRGTSFGFFAASGKNNSVSLRQAVLKR